MLAAFPCPRTVHGLLPMENPTRPATPIVKIESKNLRMTPLPEPSQLDLNFWRRTERERAGKPYMPAAKLCQPAHGRVDARKGLRVTKFQHRKNFLKQSCLFSRPIGIVGN
jgi:hypothetical protein